MFLELIRLHKSSRSPVPLEDFNTEAFAGVLKMYPEVLDQFCNSFLKLPEDKYLIRTQLRQTISGDDPNCIVDFVLEGENNICFIENKVESSEGYKQLERYIKALKENHPGKKHYLNYCTLYADPKNIQNFDGFKFEQFRWYEIARFLKQFEEKPGVQLYLEFLKEYKMNEDYTLKTEDLITMERMRKTLEIALFHLDNVKADFDKKFNMVKTDKNFHWDQLRDHSRLCYYQQDVLVDNNEKASKILYGIDLNKLKLFLHVQVDKGHTQYDDFHKLLGDPDFIHINLPNNHKALQITSDLGQFLNEPNADGLIARWFKTGFERLQKLISQDQQLSWNLKLAEEQ